MRAITGLHALPLTLLPVAPRRLCALLLARCPAPALGVSRAPGDCRLRVAGMALTCAVPGLGAPVAAAYGLAA